jgi:hypothetical protein
VTPSRIRRTPLRGSCHLTASAVSDVTCAEAQVGRLSGTHKTVTESQRSRRRPSQVASLHAFARFFEPIGCCFRRLRPAASRLLRLRLQRGGRRNQPASARRKILKSTRRDPRPRRQHSVHHGAQNYLSGRCDNAITCAPECWLAGPPDHLFPQSFAKAIDQNARRVEAASKHSCSGRASRSLHQAASAGVGQSIRRNSWAVRRGPRRSSGRSLCALLRRRRPSRRQGFRSSAKPSHASGSATAHKMAIGRKAAPANLA